MEIREVAFPRDPKRPLCLALVADLHDSVPGGLWEALLEKKPSAVLFTGDVVHGKGRSEQGLRFLKECSSRFLTCCSLGNHEFKYGTDFREDIRKTGAVLLDDDYIKTDGLVIGGLTTGFAGTAQGTFRRTPAPNTAWLDGFCEQKGYRILLSHHPEYFDLLRNYNIDLILSGHAHGGQWRLFGLPVFAPGQGIFPRYTSGFYGDKMFVSRGISNPAPVPRIGNKTELVFFTSE
ncbi:MAG: metallophosphoesterase [Clostridia bacterium]|nr:metallophosphoesterase [Clostridia bacterium]